MPWRAAPPRRITTAMVALIVMQLFCTVFFIADVIRDFQDMGAAAASQPHLYIETLATLSLAAAIVLEVQVLLHLLRRQARLEGRLAQARAAVHEILEAHFTAWALTPAERDIASFVVKGLSTAEIAQLRGNAEGTIKAHLNAIYRKSGARNRSDLLSLLMDALIADTTDPALPHATAIIPPSDERTHP